MLAPSWVQLASSWAHIGPRSGFPAAPEPTQALPNSFPVASGPPKPPFVPYKTQHRPQKGSQTSNLDLRTPQLGPQKTPTWIQKAPSQALNPAAQAWRMGRSLFILRRTPVRSASDKTRQSKTTVDQMIYLGVPPLPPVFPKQATYNGSLGFMLAHVGFMLVMLALCWPYVGSMLDLCWIKLDHVGSS